MEGHSLGILQKVTKLRKRKKEKEKKKSMVTIAMMGHTLGSKNVVLNGFSAAFR